MPKRMDRILFLITDLNVGGTEKVVFETVTRIDRNKFQPIVIGLKKRGTYAERIRQAGIPVETIDLHRNPLLFPLALFQTLFRLVRRVKRERIALIHAFLFQANVIAKIVGMICSVPVIASHRGFEKKGSWRYVLERLTNRGARLILVNSDALRREVASQLSLPQERIRTVYNGVEVPEDPPADHLLMVAEFSLRKTDIIVSTVGRLHPVKGFPHLIKAAAMTRDAGPAGRRIVFLIAGDGPDRDELTALAIEQGVAERIIFCGWRDDTARIISASDIFVLTSLAEGFPNVVLEAMACARPVIATNVGGIPEIIENGADGILVPPADPKALADRIAALAADPALRRQLGENARAKVTTKFPMDRMVNGHAALYEEILGAQRS